MHGVELVPAAVAVGGGAALLGGIAAHEYRREAAMRASRQTYGLTFPVATSSDAVASALRSLSGLGHRIEIVAEVVADESGIKHLLHVPSSVASSVVDQLSAAMPGLRVDELEARTTGGVTAAARIAVPVQALLRTDDVEAGSRALLEGMTSLRAGERVSLRWALRPSPAPHVAEPTKAGPTSSRSQLADRAWRGRVSEPGFLCAGLVLVRAENVARARGLVSHAVSVLRGRRGLGPGLVIRRGSVRATSVMPTTGRGRGWLSSSELVPLLAWPLGSHAVDGVELGAARRLPVPRHVARHGRQLLLGRDAYGERPVALSAAAAMHHVAIVGPSGVGKSVLLARGILDDIAAGFGGTVIDLKGPDLVNSVLDRVPARHADRIVVLDPSAGGPVPGLNLLGVGDPDLRADVVLGALGAIFKDSWGVRTDTYLRLGLRTLSELPQPVLTDWMRLFTEPTFRRQAVTRLRDPLMIAAWQGFEALSAADQNQHVAAPMAKVLSLLSRPAVRGVLAQTDPKLDIGRLLAERKWLVVSLSPGTLGEPAARLLSAILVYAIWTAIEARAALPAAKRTSVFLHVDELQSLAALPFGLEYLFERARGLGCGVTVATQALGRLPDSLRHSLLGNVGSLVTFRLGYDEAVRIARDLPGLDASDIQALRRFEVAARVSTGTGSAVSVVTGRTEPPAPIEGHAARIRLSSAERYGQDTQALDDELRRQQQADVAVPDAPVGRKRRAS